MTAPFDPAAERARFEARLPFLERHWTLRLDLGEGVAFQPETAESVEDQVRETFWSEGMDPALAPAEAWAEMGASFAALSPRREAGGWSLAATLYLGFPEEQRASRMADLAGLPEALRLVLQDGTEVVPVVDRGHTGHSKRLPAVLALRYTIPAERHPVALRAVHSTLAGRFEAPTAWRAWLPEAAKSA